MIRVILFSSLIVLTAHDSSAQVGNIGSSRPGAVGSVGVRNTQSPIGVPQKPGALPVINFAGKDSKCSATDPLCRPYWLDAADKTNPDLAYEGQPLLTRQQALTLDVLVFAAITLAGAPPSCAPEDLIGTWKDKVEVRQQTKANAVSSIVFKGLLGECLELIWCDAGHNPIGRSSHLGIVSEPSIRNPVSLQCPR
jgi:hypothetical protein